MSHHWQTVGKPWVLNPKLSSCGGRHCTSQDFNMTDDNKAGFVKAAPPWLPLAGDPSKNSCEQSNMGITCWSTVAELLKLALRPHIPCEICKNVMRSKPLSVFFPSFKKYMTYRFKSRWQDVRRRLCAAAAELVDPDPSKSSCFNTKTKMKPLLSVHPWVSFCSAELNMTPFSLLEEPGSLLFEAGDVCARRTSRGALIAPGSWSLVALLTGG